VTCFEHLRRFRRPDAERATCLLLKEEGYRRCDELAAEQSPNLDDVDFATAQALEVLV
jgi:hypothetical protein